MINLSSTFKHCLIALSMVFAVLMLFQHNAAYDDHIDNVSMQSHMLQADKDNNRDLGDSSAFASRGVTPPWSISLPAYAPNAYLQPVLPPDLRPPSAV